MLAGAGDFYLTLGGAYDARHQGQRVFYGSRVARNGFDLGPSKLSRWRRALLYTCLRTGLNVHNDILELNFRNHRKFDFNRGARC